MWWFAGFDVSFGRGRQEVGQGVFRRRRRRRRRRRKPEPGYYRSVSVSASVSVSERHLRCARRRFCPRASCPPHPLRYLPAGLAPGGGAMLKWLRRRRLSEAGERRLLIALARAEEELVRTHVQNVLEVLDAVGDELPVRRAVEMYLNEMQLEDPRSTIIAQRVRSRLEEKTEIDQE